MKKTRFIPLLMILPFVFTSCGKNSINISIFLYNSNDTFINSLEKSLTEKLEIYGYNTKSFFAEGSQLVQNEQIVQELKKSDILVVNPVDRISSSLIIEKAQKTNKPVIFVNREPRIEDLKGTENCFYVGTNPQSEGEIQAKIIEEYFIDNQTFLDKFDKNKNGMIDIILIKGEQGHQDTENRSIYFLNALKKSSFQTRVLDARFCDWDRSKAESYLKEIYSQYEKDIDVIVSNNDDMAMGAADFLKTTEGYDHDMTMDENFFPIIGVDGTNVGLEGIKNGDIYATVKNEEVKQATAIIDLIDLVFGKKEYKDLEYEFINGNFIHINGIKIDKNNVESYLNSLK